MENNDALNEEIAELEAINKKPFATRLGFYSKKSGPGWLQGAITLGGGSLAGALYLGVFMGYNMMWLQPLAMILGVIMLSAISYVTLSTGQRPFQAIKQHVSPVLGWAWIIATLMANIVWCMPQFALGTAAIQQNLMPSVGNSTMSTTIICAVLLVGALIINVFYESGNKGIKLFELILKILVGVVVISFFGVVVALSVNGQLDWGAVFKGLIPDPSLLGKPAPTFDSAIAATGSFSDFWIGKIASDQRDIMMTAFGTAVGINMTFLLPYSMLKKGWGKPHRTLAIFDLSIGLIVPFVLATTCVVIAAASQFHTQFGDVLNEDGSVRPEMTGAYNKVIDVRLKAELGDKFAALDDDAKAAARSALPKADRELAAMLAKRDNFNLANALKPLAGKTISQTVFGIGVLGMAVSTIIILMLINGFTLCEMLGKPGNRTIHLTGALIAGVGGFLGPMFLWSNASSKAALAIPTSVIGGAMIPIAYFTFLLLMNSKTLLGDAKPTGAQALKWNILMTIATVIATAGSVWVLMGKGIYGKAGIAGLVILFILGLAGFLKKTAKAKADAQLISKD
ncbi:MAG: divalent metal cation transporter [Verrucomicrobiota bacterium]